MSEAGYCFCGAAKKGGTTLIAVAMKGSIDSSRFADVISMFDYGFANYRTVKLMAAGTDTGRIWVRGGSSTYVKTTVPEGAYVTLPNEAASSRASKKIVMYENVKAPLKKGTKVGEVRLYRDGKKVGSSAIVISKDVKKGGPWSAFYISDLAFIIGAAVVIAVIIILIMLRRGRKRRRARKERMLMQARRQKAMEIARKRAEKNDRDWPF
jgi:D-alanyl-D-alanine carboxypeptidase